MSVAPVVSLSVGSAVVSWIVWTPAPGIEKLIVFGTAPRVRLADRRTQRAGSATRQADSIAWVDVGSIAGRVDDERGVDRSSQRRIETAGRRSRNRSRVGLDIGHVHAAIAIRVDDASVNAADGAPFARDHPVERRLGDVLFGESAVARRVAHLHTLALASSQALGARGSIALRPAAYPHRHDPLPARRPRGRTPSPRRGVHH